MAVPNAPVLVRQLLVESLVVFIFYMIFLMCYAVIINHYFRKFLEKTKQEGKQLFKGSAFTAVSSRLKLKEKEKEK